MPLSITKPTVGGDSGAWGTILNTALDDIKTFVDGVETTADAAMPKAGGTFTDRIEVVDVVAAVHNIGSSAITSAGGLDIDNGNYFYASLSTNRTVGVPGNLPSTGTLCSWVLEVTNSSTHVLSWNLAYEWPGGSAPNQTENGTDIYVCWTRDGGSTIYAVKIAEDVS